MTFNSKKVSMTIEYSLAYFFWSFSLNVVKPFLTPTDLGVFSYVMTWGWGGGGGGGPPLVSGSLGQFWSGFIGVYAYTLKL